MLMIRQNNASSAFTIVELLVVIVVIGILAAITIVSYTGITQRAVISSLQSDLVSASTQLKIFSIDNSNYPSTISTDCAASPDTNTNKCLKVSNGAAYAYYVDNTTNNQNFCITATKNNYSYSVNNTGTVVSAAFCPVLYLDAGNTASYPGTGTAWSDLSGNGNNGTLNGGVIYSGTNGGILSFDGVNDYASVASGVNLIQNSKYFSMGLLFNMNSLASLRGLMGTLNYGCSANLGLVASGNTLSMYNDTATCYNVDLSGWVETNKWLFAVATYDGVTTKVYGIKDGVLSSASGSSKSGLTNTFSSDFRVMGNQSSANFTNGSCQYAVVFNRVISQSEITQIYNNIKGRYGF